MVVVYRATQHLSAYLSRYSLWLLALGAALVVIMALMPLRWAIVILVAGLAFAAALVQPLTALALALLIGPTRALLATMFPGSPLYPGQTFFGIFVLAWLLRGLFRRRLRITLTGFSVPLLSYLLIGALSLWGAADPLSGLGEWLKWLQMLVLAVLVFDSCRRRHVGWVLTAALASGVLQSIIGLWQFGLRGSGPETFEIAQGLYRAYGTFEQPNPFGGFLGMVWPLAFGIFLGLLSETRLYQDRPYRTVIAVLALGVAVVALVGLVLSYSRGAWVGALAAAGVMGVFWPRERWRGITMALILLVAGLGLARVGALPVDVVKRFASVMAFTRVQDVRGLTVDSDNFSLIERMAHWQAASRMADAHPWLGVGLGNFQAAYPDYRLLNWDNALGHAHNVYLNTIAETGFLGLGAYLLLWGSVFLVTLRAARVRDAWWWGVALGLLGVWTHLAVHNLVDYLFVNNLPLYLGSLLGVLAVICARTNTGELTPDDKNIAEVGG